MFLFQIFQWSSYLPFELDAEVQKLICHHELSSEKLYLMVVFLQNLHWFYILVLVYRFLQIHEFHKWGFLLFYYILQNSLSTCKLTIYQLEYFLWKIWVIVSFFQNCTVKKIRIFFRYQFIYFFDCMGCIFWCFTIESESLSSLTLINFPPN